MAPFLIELADCPRPFAGRPDQSVLQALAAVHHQRIASGCHGGGCGVCLIRVVAGRYDAGRMSRAHVSAEDEARGIVLACRTYPRSDMIVEPCGKLPARLARRCG